MALVKPSEGPTKRSRGSSTAQGYGADWRKLRARVLREEPDCRRCGAHATDVDHIVPRRQGGTNDRTNLQALCKQCHSYFTALTDGGFANEVRRDAKPALQVWQPSETPTPLDIAVEMVPIDQLRPDPANPRRISNEQLESLTRSLRTYGFVQPVLARREDRTVIGGHQRLLAARRLGYREVPVIFLDLTQEQARVLNVGLNKIAGEWDQELLAQLLKDLDAFEGLDLSLTGFGDDEVGKLLKRLELRDKRERPESFDLDAALEAVRAAPRAQPGEIWQLGDHRLMCGDSTNAEDVARLFAGEKAALLSTDPPYLVDYDGGERAVTRGNKGRTQKHWDTYHDPQQSVDFYKRFLQAALPHALPKVAVYQWHATIRQHLVMRAWEECGLHLHQTIVWVKPRAVLTRSHYMWMHEPCFYGWVEGQQPQRKPPANARTVWQIGGENDNIHPTQKPLAVFERPIEYHTEVGDIVFEPFSGSGTQIIAAERLGRRCLAMEQEPHYVDVAVLRWEAFSGQNARRLA
jgi:DNA modification methylase